MVTWVEESPASRVYVEPWVISGQLTITEL